MADRITGFYPGTTKKFTIQCNLNGEAEDISSDVVTFRMKAAQDDSDADAVLTKVADVATQGTSGIAIFELAETETNIPVANYYVDIVWDRQGGAEYVIYSGMLAVKGRISDA